VINSGVVFEFTLIQQLDGVFRCMYARSSDSYLVQRTSADGVTWSAESVVAANFTSHPDLIQEQDSGYFRVIYTSTGG
jgi:hypothetical protein